MTGAPRVHHTAQLGVRLRQARERKQMTMGDVAAVAHVSKATLSALESGAGSFNPTLATMAALARVYGYNSLEELWGPLRVDRDLLRSFELDD